MRARWIRKVDKQKDPNLPTEQHGEVVRVSKPPSFLKSFLKLPLLITGRYYRVIPLCSPSGEKNLLGIMGCIFRHSLIHFVERMSEEEEKLEKIKRSHFFA